MALGKEVTQSSIWSVTNPASYAVDGDTSSTFRIGGHCAHTGIEVSLLGPKRVPMRVRGPNGSRGESGAHTGLKESQGPKRVSR